MFIAKERFSSNRDFSIHCSFSDWHQWFDRRTADKLNGNIDDNTNIKYKNDMVDIIDLVSEFSHQRYMLNIISVSFC